MTGKQPSFRDLPLRETGGIEARQGFDLQDHIAAGQCLHMIVEPRLVEVLCETHDDILLLWREASEDTVEFIQVKGTEFNQLWTIAKLCQRDKGTGTSVLEKSLDCDRALETSRFRIITARQLAAELRPLTFPIDNSARSTTDAAFATLAGDVTTRVGDFKSAKGNDCGYWLTHTLWEVTPDVETLRVRNCYLIVSALNARGHLAAPDRAEDIYSRLLVWVKAAALAPAHQREEKAITKDRLLNWFDELASNRPMPVAGTLLSEKMNRAGLDEVTVRSAHDARVVYRNEVLKSRYLEADSRDSLEAQVSSTLLRLRSDLDSGQAESGAEFHRRCLAELHTIEQRVSVDTPALEHVLQGYMYDLTDRCLHRFTKGHQ